MKKGKVARLVGFVGALGLSSALVATAVQGTGAYLTSSVDGHLTGKVGTLKVTSTTTALDFTDLVPGVDQSKTISYTNDWTSDTKADIWLVFDPNSAGYGAFTGAKTTETSIYKTNSTSVTDGGMGQYGHFKVTGQQGHKFESYNLQLKNVDDAMNAYSNTVTGVNTCAVDGNGNGGSDVQHTIGNGTDIAECGVPAAILLQTGLAVSTQGSATVSFGVTGKMSDQGSNQPTYTVPFKIVATQPGQYPLVTNGSNTTDPQRVGEGNVGTNW